MSSLRRDTPLRKMDNSEINRAVPRLLKIDSALGRRPTEVAVHERDDGTASIMLFDRATERQLALVIVNSKTNNVIQSELVEENLRQVTEPSLDDFFAKLRAGLKVPEADQSLLDEAVRNELLDQVSDPDLKKALANRKVRPLSRRQDDRLILTVFDTDTDRLIGHLIYDTRSRKLVNRELDEESLKRQYVK